MLRLKEIVIHEGIVLYDSRINRFVNVRGFKDGSYLCSFANFYNDSKTTIGAYPLSEEYLKGCEPVIELDKHYFAHFNNVGWSVYEEDWEVIKGFDTFEVSNIGRVRRKEDNFLRKPVLADNGYAKVTLFKEKKKYTRNIGRLVAIALIPNRQSLPCVNHIDGNKTNNHFRNLEWC